MAEQDTLLHPVVKSLATYAYTRLANESTISAFTPVSAPPAVGLPASCPLDTTVPALAATEWTWPPVDAPRALPTNTRPLRLSYTGLESWLPALTVTGQGEPTSAG